MDRRDARRLAPAALAQLQRRVLRAVTRGQSQRRAAARYGVARGTVHRWVQAVRQGGLRALRPRRRGRPPGPRLAAPQARRLLAALAGGYPEQLGVRALLWNRAALQQAVARQFGLRLSLTTLGRHLHAWGLGIPSLSALVAARAPHRHTMFLLEGLPALRTRARRAGATLAVLDIVALRLRVPPAGSQLPGGPPAPPAPLWLFSVRTQRGWVGFLLLRNRSTGNVTEFLRRLVASHPRPLLLVTPCARVVDRLAVQQWLAAHHRQLTLDTDTISFLGGYR